MKKLLAFIFATAVLIYTGVPIIAIDTTQEISSKIITELRFLSSTSFFEDSGNENLNLSTLTVGEEIHTYVYENDQFIESNCLYPLLSNGELYLIATPIEDYMQISTGLVNELRSVDTSKPFALIYDRENCYFYSEGRMTLLVADNEPVISRSVLNPSQQFPAQTFETSDFNTSSPLGYTPALSPNAVQSAYIECSGFQFVTQQPFSKLCWAACVASIANYLTGSSYSAQQLGMLYWHSAETDEYNKMIPVGAEVGLLEDYANCQYIFAANAIPDRSTTRENITNGYPIIAHFRYDEYNAGTGHMCVIKGTGDEGNSMYLYVMDPKTGFVAVRYVDGKFKYLPNNAQSMMYMFAASCESW